MLSGISASLVTSPTKVLGVSIENKNSIYFTNQLRFQNLLSIVLAIFFSLGVYLFTKIELLTIIFSGLTVYFLQCYELMRAFHLTRFEYKKLLLVDSFVHFARIILLYILYSFGYLSASTSFLVLLVTYSFSWLSMKDYLTADTNKESFREVILANWKYGKWLLLETTAFLASSRIYLYLIGLLLSLELAGVLAAVQNLLNSANVIVMGVMAFAIPVARKKYLQSGHLSWMQWLLFIGTVLVFVVGVLLIIVSIYSNEIMNIVYSEFYAKYSYLIPILGIAYIISTVNTVLSAAFRTVEQPQKGAYAKFVSAIITLLISYPLLLNWGLIGAVTGLILTQVIWLMVYTYFLAKGSLRQSNIKLSAVSGAE